MISSSLCFEQPRGQKRERETATRAGAAIRNLTWMRHLLTAGVIKQTELLIRFKEKQENESIWVKIVIIVNIRNEKVVYVVSMSKIPYKSKPYYQ